MSRKTILPEPKIAIVGYATRLPGASNAEQMWDVLTQERCSISDIPDDRWSKDRFFDPDKVVKGKTYSKRAGTLEDVYDFDNGYFGITPRDAEQMDPQQRLLLETVAQAFDHAGIDPQRLAKDKTGVFVGAASSDHSTTGIQDLGLIDSHYMIGNTLSIFSNRIAYHWDLRGPSYTVDTACSSGLFALDQARHAIESGRVDTAIVGSVSLLLSPIPFVGFSQASMLSQTGLCQSFSENADGYVRAEGAVVFIIQRESVARLSQNRIRSYLYATDTNSDGRTPGIAMPCADSQQKLLERIREDFEIDPNQFAYVEAHGTGTPVGDPVEAQAIGRAFGQDRDEPLMIGSVKTNFGHLEPVAGLVGLLKAQLILENNLVPASLHSNNLNSGIPFSDLGLEVVQAATPLEKREKPWLVGVNSFGFGGANAHAVLQQASVYTETNDIEMPKALLISAQDETALASLADQWAKRAANSRISEMADGMAVQVANANQRLGRHRYRLSLLAGTVDQLAASLSDWQNNGPSKTAGFGTSPKNDRQIAFCFSGNGSQWPGMGRHLFLSDPTFRRSIEKTDELVLAKGGRSVVESLLDPALQHSLDRAPVAQLLLLAIQIAVVDCLAKVGVRPHATLGHSAGELAAAYAAQTITREVAVYSIIARSRTLDQLFEKGGMAALVCTATQAQDLIDQTGVAVDIAAENSEKSLTLAGDKDELKHLLKVARKKRIAGKMLAINYPYHSRFLEPFQAQLTDELEGLNGVRSDIALYSGCLGDKISGDMLTPDYWWKNARDTVQFRQAVQAMARDGLSLFLEVSPKSVLQTYIRDSLEQVGAVGEPLGALEETRAEEYDINRIALNILAQGGSINEEPLLGPAAPFLGGLPEYPFTRQTLHLGSETGLDIFGRRHRHALLGGRVTPNAPVWTGDLSLARLPWLADHKIGGQILLPATAMLEMFVEAAAQIAGQDKVALRDLEIMRSVRLAPDQIVFSRVSYDAAARRLLLETRTTGDWQAIAQAFCYENVADLPTGEEVAGVEKPEGLYAALSSYGLDYGPAFACVNGLSKRDEQSVSVVLGAPKQTSLEFRVDPMRADAAMHGVAVLLKDLPLDPAVIYVPGRMGRVSVFSAGQIAGARLKITCVAVTGLSLDITYFAADGTAVMQIEELRLRPFPREQRRRPLFWDEAFVALSSHNVADTSISTTAEAPLAQGTAPTNLEVLRDAIGNRIAWDLVRGVIGKGSFDRRYKTAVDLLEAMDLLKVNETGEMTVTGECPWPDLDNLLDLLASSVPEAADELFAALHAATSDGDKCPISRDDLCRSTLHALSAGIDRPGRVLITGLIDPEVVDEVVSANDHVTIAATNDAEADRLCMAINQSEKLFVTSLEALSSDRRFDTVIGIAVGETLSNSQRKRLIRMGAAGAKLMIVEAEPDSFELMTGRYPDASVFDDVVELMHERLEDVTHSTSAKFAHVRVITARYPKRQSPELKPFNIIGEDALAVQLREVCPEGHAQADIVCLKPDNNPMTAALDQGDLLRWLPKGNSVLWVLQEGLKHEASLRGWRRVAVNETRRDIRTLSFREGRSAREILSLLSTTTERELILDDRGVCSPRIVPVIKNEKFGPQDCWVLKLRKQGRIETLSWKPQKRSAPEPHEVEIEVAATGLNFRDVMWSQGLLPAEMLEGGFAGPTLGMECAGRIIRAGEHSGLQEGQQVLAFAPGAFATHVTVQSDTVMALPENINPVEAATIPVAFLTADYALTELSRLQAGEWVLIHGGAGGVGIAAIQIAKHAGARVIATAGTPQKRRLMRAMGAEIVSDSRSLAFVSGVHSATGGRGVDVVVNSLAGEALEQTLACLAPFGRFVELGKRDFLTNSALGMRVLRNNISFFGVDADQLLIHRREVATRTMRRVMRGFEDGAFSVLPHRVFAHNMVDEAFRLMQKSGHIGKIVIRTPPSVVLTNDSDVPDLSGRWLITGGTGGFGLATAEWLAEQGAREFWLVSRSGKISEEAAQRLSNLGVRVHLCAADVSDADQVTSLFAKVVAEGSDLDGIVHAAAHFDDALIEASDREHDHRVLSAKLMGPYHLHKASAGMTIRHFWLYSSVAARFGNPGQGPYVAANTGLEALARARRAEGLSALAIAWGPIGDAGYLDRSEDLLKVVERKTGETMQARDALNALGDALQASPPRATITIGSMEWSRLSSDIPVLSEPLFEQLHISANNSALSGGSDLAALIAEKGKTEARAVVLEILLLEASQIMRVAPAAIDTQLPLMDMGFDSLMGMNLKLAAEERLGIEIPIAMIGEGVNFTSIARDAVDAVSKVSPVEEHQAQVVMDMKQKHLRDSDMPEEIVLKIIKKTGSL